MSNKTQTLLFLSVSVLVFLLYVKIDRGENNNLSVEPFASKAASQKMFEKSILPGRSIEPTHTRGSAIDQIKTKLKSVISEKVDERLEKNVGSTLQWLKKIAEDHTAAGRADGLAEPAAGKSLSDNFKCISHGALAEAGGGDRVEAVFHVDRNATVWFSFEGKNICESHFSRSVIAQYVLGAAYLQGDFIPQNYPKALKWYLKASENGFPLADYDLGTMYSNGNGVTQNKETAAQYFRKAADQGVADAQDGLGDMYFYGRYFKQNYAEALKWYRQAADQGNSNAQNNLGIMYENGYGVKADQAIAIKWYRKAAARNDAYAQFNLGNYYADHYPFQYDFNEAFRWYREAAENGHAGARMKLGILYQLGRGTQQNFAAAVKCYRAAARLGDAEAMAHLGYLYAKGLGVGQYLIKAQNLYVATAQKADADTLFSFGVGWEHDDCQPHDNAMAYLWYRLAAYKGMKVGKENCSCLSKKMTAAQILQAKEISRQIIEQLAH